MLKHLILSKTLANKCLSEINLTIFKVFGSCNEFRISDFVLDANGLPRTKNSFIKLGKINNTGIYVFKNPFGTVSYVGKGGGGNNTVLKTRISQELRLYRQSTNGNNGGTLSKNIQDIDKCTFNDESEWKTYIAKWNLIVIDQRNWSVSINLIEAFAIQVFDPKYNVDK
jgi:hypothetical protein